MSTLHRRAWLKQSSLALAGLSFAGRFSTSANGPARKLPAETVIRLTSNENPYGPSPMARKAMADAIQLSNRYPWNTTTTLRQRIAKDFSIDERSVLMSAGSTEILGLVTLHAARQKGNAITAAPSFSSWVPTAQKLGLDIIRVPLTPDKKHDLPAMLAKINTDTRLVYVCNPNNPTGTVLPSEDVKRFVEEASRKALVLLDEAYIEYCDQPSLSNLVKDNRNIIIAKTFSKIYGLAGARVGYALAHPDTINKLADLQPWPNGSVSAVSAAAALASLDDKDFLDMTRNNTRKAGAYAMKELQSMGFECIPSNTNFLYYSIRSVNGNWQELLQARNILTGRMVEESDKWTRTTIGTMEEMQSFIRAAKQIV